MNNQEFSEYKAKGIKEFDEIAERATESLDQYIDLITNKIPNLVAGIVALKRASIIQSTKDIDRVKKRWTTERPTIPGRYWVYAKRSLGDAFIDIVNVWYGGQKNEFLINDGLYYGGSLMPRHITHYMGPIDEPEPPR